MSKFIQTWLLPLLLILSNGFLGWLINQLPGKQDLKIDDPLILVATYEVISKNKAALDIIKLSSQESEDISRKYLENINEIYPVYVYLVLLDERQAGRIPAWESIRIVRERVEQ